MDIVLIILSIIGIIFLIGFLLVLFAYIIERRRKRKQFEKDIENFYTEYDELFNKKKQLMLYILIFGVGLISGMYIITQIEKGINKNIKKETYTDFVKKHYKKNKHDKS